MISTKKLFVIFQGLLLVLMMSPLQAAPYYKIIDIGSIFGGDISFAFGVNNSGLVTGDVITPNTGSDTPDTSNPEAPEGSSSAARQVFVADAFNNTSIKLSNLNDGNIGYSLAINDSGYVTGFTNTTEDTSDQLWRAFIGNSSEGLTDLGTLDGSIGSISKGYDINNSGRVVGVSTLENGSYRAFRSVDGIDGSTNCSVTNCLDQLDTLNNNSGDYGFASGVNDAGLVVGHSSLSGTSNLHAFVTTSENGVEVKDLGVLANDEQSYAKDININNNIVGGSKDNDNNIMRAFMVNSESTLDQSGIDLGALSTNSSFTIANSINDDNTVVGTSTTEEGLYNAFIWNSIDQEMLNLNNLVQDMSGWDYLETANTISNSGYIVGFGINSLDKTRQAFMLVEVPEPTLFPLMLLGLIMLGAFHSQQAPKMMTRKDTITI